MSWQTEMRAILRTLVNDEAGTSYTDARLANVLAVAARHVSREIDFPVAYEVDVTAPAITPDPTEGDGRDENFIDLVTTKGACIIDRGAAALAAGRSLMVQDGSSRVDLRESWKAFVALLKSGWCAVYEQMKTDYQTGQAGDGTGAGVFGPFRVFARGLSGAPYGTAPTPFWTR